mmetsp:Transcript_29095/g.94889  ORF Transcript_29095/g.94889 Transcript_29095/m.94889 type:complete len:255 (+) Transcript_29095:114-878(+)
MRLRLLFFLRLLHLGPVPQLPVMPVERKELAMGALLHDATLVHHHDLVRVLDRGQPVRDHDRGAPLGLEQLVQRRLHHALALRVQRAGGLVQQQDGRVPQDGARDAHALLLPARDAPAAQADARLVPLRHGHDEVVGVGGARGRDHLLLRGVRLAVANVLADGGVEQCGLLVHQTHHSTQPVQVERGDGPPVEQHFTLLRVVEALQQLDHGALAAARRAHQRHRGAGLHGQAKVLEHGSIEPRGVREADILERD